MYTTQRKTRKYLTEEGINYCIQQYKNNIPIQEIATKLDIHWNAIKGILKRRGVYEVKYPNIDNQLEKIICDKYKTGDSSYKLSKDLSISKFAILDVLKRNNIEKRQNIDGNLQRKYTLNQDYFETIDTQEKAYILGFIYADGYNNEKTGTLQITLHNKDVEILEFIKSQLNTNKPIYNIKRENRPDVVSLVINSKKISNNLVDYGVMQCKTHKIKFPLLPKEYISHFIRGYFDGDGYVGNNVIEIVGTIDFLTSVQNILVDECSLNKTKLHQRHKDRDNNIRRLTYGGRLQIERIFNYLYQDANFYLKRKYNKFIFNQV